MEKNERDDDKMLVKIPLSCQNSKGSGGVRLALQWNARKNIIYGIKINCKLKIIKRFCCYVTIKMLISSISLINRNFFIKPIWQREKK